MELKVFATGTIGFTAQDFSDAHSMNSSIQASPISDFGLRGRTSREAGVGLEQDTMSLMSNRILMRIMSHTHAALRRSMQARGTLEFADGRCF